LLTATAGALSNSAEVQFLPTPISISGPATVDAGMPYMLSLDSAALGSGSITSWAIDWGDGIGTPDTETISTSPLPSAVPHVFSGSGPYVITAMAVTSSGTFWTSISAGPAGSLDSNFAATPGTNESFEALANLPDGGVIAGGTDSSGNPVLASFYAEGANDVLYSTASSGMAVRALAVQPVGPNFDVVAAEFNQNTGSFSLVRYALDGSLDTYFGATGSPVSGETFRPDRLAIEADGSILVAGYTYSSTPDTANLVVVHYTAEGALDTFFGSGGAATAVTDAYGDDPCGMALDAQGNIVLAGTANVTGQPGEYEFALARFLPNGTLDSSFGDGGTVLDYSENGEEDHATAAAIEPNGEILVAGYNSGTGTDTLDLVCYQSDGSEDSTFCNTTETTSGIQAGPVSSVVVDAAGNVLVGWNFGSDSFYEFGISRFSSGGLLDSTFNDGVSSGEGTVALGCGSGACALGAMTLQPDGSIIAAGALNATRSTDDPYLARIYDSESDSNCQVNIGGAVVSVHGRFGSQFLPGIVPGRHCR
jgi:uncharacterized delta-60 repeat protein